MAEKEKIGNSNFKSIFKYYKQKQLTDFSNVLNFDNRGCLPDNGLFDKRKMTFLKNTIFGLKPTEFWCVYSIGAIPGLMLVRNPFTSVGQRYWIARCLRDFPCKENKRNIDIDASLKDVDQFWEHCLRSNISNLDKLRWATLGYHHNWNTKMYSEDMRTHFPSDLAHVSRYVAHVLGYPDYQAQAAIINMYHPGTHLSGHVDSSEVELDAPLLSFSFGQSAIFLIGGETLEEHATPILLQSGDILVMSQEARLCYHAVPRILPSTSSPWNDNNCVMDPSIDLKYFNEDLINSVCDSNFWTDFERYVSRSRINMNVRQVLPLGQASLGIDAK